MPELLAGNSTDDKGSGATDPCHPNQQVKQVRSTAQMTRTIVHHGLPWSSIRPHRRVASASAVVIAILLVIAKLYATLEVTLHLGH